MAIGILVLMLSMAGQVFNLTIQSTGQAVAVTKVSQLLRAFERTLREDLKHVQPGQSILLIQGNPVNAYWTPEGREADYDANPATGYPHVADPAREDASGNMIPPRADILMFFTARKTTSFVDPNVTSPLQQVVYGHAELGEYVPGPIGPGTSPYVFGPGPAAFPVQTIGAREYPSPEAVSPVPAARWHLSRRNVLLVSAPPPTPVSPPWVDADAMNVPAHGLADNSILLGETDVVGNFDYEDLALTPGGWYWCLPAIFDDALAGGRIGGPHIPHARAKLDPKPPALYANRLGHYFLPNCASFKVEWTLDPRSEFVEGRLEGEEQVYWFDPGDPNHPLAELAAVVNVPQGEPPANLASLLNKRTNHRDGVPPSVLPYSLADRFWGDNDPNYSWLPLALDGRSNLVVFGAKRRNLGTNPSNPSDDEIVPEDIFPALRITIDVFDSERRLDRPTRHVMVIPVGG